MEKLVIKTSVKLTGECVASVYAYGGALVRRTRIGHIYKKSEPKRWVAIAPNDIDAFPFKTKRAAMEFLVKDQIALLENV